MRGSRKLWLAVVAAGIAAGSAVLAAEGDGKGAPGRGEGKPRGEWFKEMDADGNGTVSLAEFTAAHEKRMEARKEKMGDKWDADRAAKMPAPEERFKEMDKDGDGELTTEEMRDARREGMRRHGGPKGGGPKKEATGGGKAGCATTGV